MIARLAFVITTLVCVAAAESRTRNVVLITADGLRWQDLFGGMDSTLPLKDIPLKQQMSGATPEDRRAKLMPFFWGHLASRGIVLGNVKKNSSVRVTNGFRVSYPGYSEILTGRSQDE